MESGRWAIAASMIFEKVLRGRPLRRLTFITTSKCRADGVNQIIVVKWFWQVANDSETEGLGSNTFVRLSGNQNGGNAAAKRLEAAM
jgi:hypothetical protein